MFWWSKGSEALRLAWYSGCSDRGSTIRKPSVLISALDFWPR